MVSQKEIGTFIAELRREKQLTQNQLGERLGVTNKTVSRWENGNYMPDISVLQLLCEELNVSMNELLSGQRLEEKEFRQRAEDNLVLSLKQVQGYKRAAVIGSRLGAAGTGILISVLYSPDSVRKIAAICISIAMICAGWYFRAKCDRYVAGEKESDR